MAKLSKFLVSRTATARNQGTVNSYKAVKVSSPSPSPTLKQTSIHIDSLVETINRGLALASESVLAQYQEQAQEMLASALIDFPASLQDAQPAAGVGLQLAVGETQG